MAPVRRELKRSEMDVLARLALAYPDLAEVERLVSTEPARHTPVAPPTPGRPARTTPGQWPAPREEAPPPVAPASLRPRNVGEAVALHEAGHIDRRELRHLLGFEGDSEEDAATWWPAFAGPRLGWALTWRPLALVAIVAAYLYDPRLQLPEIAAFALAIAAGVVFNRWWRRGLLGTLWRLCLAVAIFAVAYQLSPLIQVPALVMTLGLVVLDGAATVLWPEGPDTAE